MPREASPQARSRKTFVPPTVSSRSWGPDPCTRTTAGNGPLPTGMESVPGRIQGSVPNFTSDSLNFDGFA